jgi:hypothetical protein
MLVPMSSTYWSSLPVAIQLLPQNPVSNPSIVVQALGAADGEEELAKTLCPAVVCACHNTAPVGDREAKGPLAMPALDGLVTATEAPVTKLYAGVVPPIGSIHDPPMELSSLGNVYCCAAPVASVYTCAYRVVTPAVVESVIPSNCPLA